MWWRRRKRESDLDLELQAHLDLETEERVAEGQAESEARLDARRKFGNTTLIKEEVRTMWTWTLVEQVANDVRHSLRAMRRNPGFALLAITSLALGIGATTAVFSVLNAVVLRALPVPQPDRLVVIKPQFHGRQAPLFNPLFEELRDRNQSLAGMVAVQEDPYLKAAFEGAAPAYVRGSLVSGDYFRMLGLAPAAGRLLTREDDSLTAACVAVLSHTYWTRSSGADPAVIGRKVSIRDKACTIAGVAPEGFRGHETGYTPDFWIPIGGFTDPKLLASTSMAFFSGVLGRLKPGVSMAEAQSELTAVYQGMQPEYRPAERPGQAATRRTDFRIELLPGAQGNDTVRREFSRPLLLALALVGVVLLIAAVNVSNLLLSRGTARGSELATRAALGAGRLRLMRLLALEGSVLAVMGGVVGVIIASLVTPVLGRAVSLSYRPIELDTSPDWRVLLTALGATIFTALLAGVLPALRLSGSGLQTGTSGTGRTTATRSSQRFGRALIAAQLALSLLLLAGTGLLLRTMLHVVSVDPGFNTSDVVLVSVSDTEPAAKFGESDTPEQKARRASVYRDLDQRLNSIQGVRAASVSWLGLFGGSYVGLDLHAEEAPQDRLFTLIDYVSPRYFEATGMQLLRGRGFTETDREGAPGAAVVNEAFVRERVKGPDAIGRRFVMTYRGEKTLLTIVGVLRDAKYNDLREPGTKPMIWIPISQSPVKISSIALRVQPGFESAVTQEARVVLEKVSPYVIVRKVTTLRGQVDQATSRERLLLKLISVFGALALILAAVGVYGTLGYAVTRRTREIGVRLALGAQQDGVLRLVLRESLLLVVAGLVAGVPLALFAGRLLQSFLFGVTPYDPMALVGAGAVLTITALIAAFAPARRASRIDPMVALKYE
jgi:predicted permease